MQDTTQRQCAPRARCGDARNCQICARIRQAKIADAAERLAKKAGPLSWTTIAPNDGDWKTLIACRAAFLRAADPEGAIWTVEYGSQTGIPHANILHPVGPARELRKARVWTAPITGNVRDVAAYVSKREQMPPKEIYSGRLYGTSGPLWQWLATGKGQPVIEAAKTQYDIDPTPLRTDTGISQDVFMRGTPHAPADYREIAARRLPDLMRAVPLYGRARVTAEEAAQQPPERKPFWRPVLNSRRVCWLTGTLRPWVKVKTG